MEIPFSFESGFSHDKVGSSFISHPRFLAAKKAIINHTNEDEEYFKWAITRALNPVEEHSERIDKILREKSKGPQFGGTEISSQFE